jgi:uncharacterized protein YjbJ (UPF0337 family)
MFYTSFLLIPPKWLRNPFGTGIEPVNAKLFVSLLTKEIMKTDTKLKIEGSWKEIKGKLKQKYAELTDDDLMYEEGQTEELLGRLQRKLGRSIDEIKEEINSL